MANGVPAEKVTCKNGLQLMIRNNGEAICAKSSSVERWIVTQEVMIVDTSIESSENDSDSSDNDQMDVDLSPEKILVELLVTRIL